MRAIALAGAFLLLLGSACASTSAASRQSPRQLQPRQIIVAIAADKGDELPAIRKALAAEYDLQEVGNFLLGSVELQCVVYQVGSDEAVPAVLARLGRDPRVALAEANQVFDERAGEPVASAKDVLAYGAVLIRADAARRSKTGKGVKIAVVDTGLSSDHHGLRGRIAETRNFVEGGEASFAKDLHGTAVAGIIAAQRDDQVGMAGIAPDAEILAVKACWYAPGSAKAVCSSWTLAKAVDYAVGAGAQILNMSLSGPPDELLRRLLEKAEQRGVIVVAAAAESADAPGFPASMSQVIAVVASDADGKVQLPAWTARTFAIAAPGVDILTTVPADGYDFLSGSSLAAAHVSGVLALLLEENPKLTASEALELLRSTARPLPGSEVVSRAGLLDACAALGRLMGSPSCP